MDAGLLREPLRSGQRPFRLETVRVCAGRGPAAGRSRRPPGAGICCRLWQQAEEHGFRPRQRPEILDADLAPFCLHLAVWGARRPEDLPWLDLPPKAHLAVAREQLAGLGSHRARHGRTAAHAPGPAAGETAPAAPAGLSAAARPGTRVRRPGGLVAALLDERDPLPLADASLALRLDRFCVPGDDHGPFRRLRQWAEHVARLADIPTGNGSPYSGASLLRTARQQLPCLGEVVALAYPERVALRSGGNNGMAQYLMRNGKAAVLPLTDSLARQDVLAVAAVDAGTRGRIRLAAALSQDVLEQLFRPEITVSEDLNVSPEGRINARRRRRLGGPAAGRCPAAPSRWRRLRPGPVRVHPRPGAACPALGRARAPVAGPCAPAAPDMGRSLARPFRCLAAGRAGNLAGAPSGHLYRPAPALPARLAHALHCLLPYPLPRRLEQLAPVHWQAPSGKSHPIMYDAEGGPFVAAKLQEFFGCEDTPHIADGRVPLTLHLLSPAGRPLRSRATLATSGATAIRRCVPRCAAAIRAIPGPMTR